jgi:hypothetical protein
MVIVQDRIYVPVQMDMEELNVPLFASIKLEKRDVLEMGFVSYQMFAIVQVDGQDSNVIILSVLVDQPVQVPVQDMVNV